MISIYLQELAASQIVTVLVPLTALDYLTGFCAASVTKELSSKIGSKGLFKKIMLYLGIMAIAVIQQALPDLPWLLQTFIMFFILNEGLSILENLDRAGVKLPSVVVNALITKKDQLDEPTKKE